MCTTRLCLRGSTEEPGVRRPRLRCSELRSALPSTPAASRHSSASCWASSLSRASSRFGSRPPSPRRRHVAPALLGQPRTEANERRVVRGDLAGHERLALAERGRLLEQRPRRERPRLGDKKKKKN